MSAGGCSDTSVETGESKHKWFDLDATDKVSRIEVAELQGTSTLKQATMCPENSG
ncbi:uncharacterized protein PHALS_10860 [Plasmopara halstedii]|uniref:Uncharacterized protein n=1 Tax=Plasmopara halstedii TaxID=4781 RepID=A0A0P1AHT1_PLAHL|nr:uncharacterized protein PHALS_10860 [Plasmopara halstedii]CEG40674.1 hypothetical protein PHALS_10860 [Plasmopara halstedii]|eukprot:XP_024577043.1 hypothetical protein PHALS_10860 [Plasmopara halstedii]